MPAKQAVKKPTKKEIEEAAKSVEEAIEKLEVEEVQVDTEEAVVPLETDKKDTPEENEEEKKVKEAPVEFTEEFSEEKLEEPKEPEENVEESKEETPEETGSVFTKSMVPEKGGKSKLIIVICLIIIFTIIGFFGGYFYAKSASSGNGPVSHVLDITPTEEPSPTSEEANLSDYSIEVLNGSGVAGVAGDEQSALETDGFSVKNTGNAKNQDYSETVIAAKSSVPKEFITKLKDSLSERYEIDPSIEELDTDNTYDVVVTIGYVTVVDE